MVFEATENNTAPIFPFNSSQDNVLAPAVLLGGVNFYDFYLLFQYRLKDWDSNILQCGCLLPTHQLPSLESFCFYSWNSDIL